MVLASPTMGAPRARDWADSSAAERVLSAIKGHEVWVAERDDRSVGWVEIDGNRVEGLYVRGAVAGRGVGSALLLRAEEVIRSAGFGSSALDASPNAEEFYRRRGYAILTEPKADRSADDGIPMVKLLGDDATL